MKSIISSNKFLLIPLLLKILKFVHFAHPVKVILEYNYIPTLTRAAKSGNITYASLIATTIPRMLEYNSLVLAVTATSIVPFRFHTFVGHGLFLSSHSTTALRIISLTDIPVASFADFNLASNSVGK